MITIEMTDDIADALPDNMIVPRAKEIVALGKGHFKTSNTFMFMALRAEIVEGALDHEDIKFMENGFTYITNKGGQFLTCPDNQATVMDDLLDRLLKLHWNK